MPMDRRGGSHKKKKEMWRGPANDISLRNIRRLCRALDVTIDFFLRKDGYYQEGILFEIDVRLSELGFTSHEEFANNIRMLPETWNKFRKIYAYAGEQNLFWNTTNNERANVNTRGEYMFEYDLRKLATSDDEEEQIMVQSINKPARPDVPTIRPELKFKIVRH